MQAHLHSDFRIQEIKSATVSAPPHLFALEVIGQMLTHEHNEKGNVGFHLSSSFIFSVRVWGYPAPQPIAGGRFSSVVSRALLGAADLDWLRDRLERGPLASSQAGSGTGHSTLIFLQCFLRGTSGALCVAGSLPSVDLSSQRDWARLPFSLSLSSNLHPTPHLKSMISLSTKIRRKMV